MGLLNIRSMVDKGALVQVTINTLDALTVTEIWIVNEDPEVIKPNAVTATAICNRGGGVCLIRDSITVKSHPSQKSFHFKTFECQLLSFNAGGSRGPRAD